MKTLGVPDAGKELQTPLAGGSPWLQVQLALQTPILTASDASDPHGRVDGQGFSQHKSWQVEPGGSGPE